MVAVSSRARARQDVVRVVHRGLDVPGLTGAVARVLERAVGFDGTCLLTLDPATLLPTGEVVEHGLDADARARLVEIELREPDVNKFSDLARGRSPAAGLGVATHGNLDRSLRQRELRRPQGFADELRLVCADGTGAWGALTLLREAGRPLFTAAEVSFVASLADVLADGLRQALLLRAAAPRGDGETGLLVLGPDDGVALADRAADRWLDALGTGDAGGVRLPVAVRAVAARARSLMADEPADEPAGDSAAPPGGLARARVRLPDGRWLVVLGSLLEDATTPRVAVLLEPVRPAELAPLVADAYGLTPRERRVTELVARGLPTDAIAARLHLSAYTVQDHLKSVFAKTGSGSRGQVVARIFLDHHAPRLTGTPDPGERSAHDDRTR